MANTPNNHLKSKYYAHNRALQMLAGAWNKEKKKKPMVSIEKEKEKNNSDLSNGQGYFHNSLTKNL